MTSAVISGTGLFTPSDVIDNQELVAAFNTYVEHFNREHADAIARDETLALQPSSSEFIEKASGIKRRHVMDRSGIIDPERLRPRLRQRSDEEPGLQCDMALKAAREALDNAGRGAADIDAVIVACSNLERPYPAVAIEVQDALGIDGFAYDMNVACSSATFGIQAAASAIDMGQARAVLVISPEICSAHLNFRDRDSHFIFGDACTAVVVESSEQVAQGKGFGIMGMRMKTRYSNNIRNNFGFLNRCEVDPIPGKERLFVQQGRKVFKEVSPMVAELIVAHLSDLGLTPEDIKRMWLHQANLNMNQLIAKRVLGRDATTDEAPVILDEYANTSSAGSIIAFHKHSADFEAGDRGVVCSFGAGYSVGSIVLRKR